MKMLLRSLALLFISAFSLSAMAQFTAMPTDLSSYSNASRQSPAPSQAVAMPSDRVQMASLSEQAGMPEQMSQQAMRKNYRNRIRAGAMQVAQQPQVVNGGINISSTTMVGPSIGNTTGDISPQFNIKYGSAGQQLGTNPYSAPTTTSPTAGVTTGVAQTAGGATTSAADLAKIQADEQIRAQNEVASAQRKCASKSSIWGLIGAAVGGYFGGPAGAAVGSTAVGSIAAKNC